MFKCGGIAFVFAFVAVVVRGAVLVHRVELVMSRFPKVVDSSVRCLGIAGRFGCPSQSESLTIVTNSVLTRLVVGGSSSSG